MRNYHHRRSIPKQLLRWRLTYRTMYGVVGGLIVIGVIGTWFTHRYLKDISPLSQQGDTQELVYTGPQPALVENDDFAFESIAAWELEASESTPPQMIIYRSRRDGLVIKELTVHYGNVPPEIPVTRVVPIIATGNKLTHENASPRCPLQNVINPKPQREVYKEITYLCDTAQSGRAIGIGQKGGQPLQLTDSSGRTMTVGLLYRDLRGDSLPDPETFYEILKSFRLK